MTRKAGYQQIKDEVIMRIQSREWPQGSVLPTEMELAAKFGCARATVNRALRELAEEGIVDRKRKSGTRVNMAPTKQARLEIAIVRRVVEDMNQSYRYALVDRVQETAPDWLRARLGLPQDARVLHVRAMHYADNAPFQFEDRWIIISTVPEVVHAPFTEQGPNEWLLAQVPFTQAEIAFSAIAADETQAEFLATTPGAPLFRAERTTWLDGAPVTFVQMTHGDGYQMRTVY